MAGSPDILVTGFPGFRANHLVHHLLASGYRVVVVVANHRGGEVERFSSALPAGLGSRLEVLEGDSCSIDMGLSGPEFRALQQRPLLIHHLGQRVDETATRAHAHAVHVGGMRETLNLAAACRSLHSVVVHSSVTVSGDREGWVRETELHAGQAFGGPASEMLALAELMAQRKRSQLPIAILRGGRVIGEPFGGKLAALDGVYRLILLVLLSPRELLQLLPGWGDTRVHAIGVHEWVRCVVALTGHPQAIGRAFHLTDREPLSLRQAFHDCLDIRARLLKEGFEMPAIGRIFLEDPLLRSQLQKMVSRPRGFLSMAFRHVHYSTDNAAELLGEALPRCSLRDQLGTLVRQVAWVAKHGSVSEPPAGFGARLASQGDEQV